MASYTRPYSRSPGNRGRGLIPPASPGGLDRGGRRQRGGGETGGVVGGGGGLMDSHSLPTPVASSSRRGNASSSNGNFDGPSKNFKVVIRVRPPLPRELDGDKPFQNVVKVSRDERAITISENVNATDDDGNPTYVNGPYSTHRFTFDTVYGQNATQEKVYNTTARAVVDSSLQGYNATIFAYGQTGTGKTYTMEGFHQHDQRGIIPRAIEQIFSHISSSVSPRLRFLVRASYLQIYNEVISDLLKPERTNLAIREGKTRRVRRGSLRVGRAFTRGDLRPDGARWGYACDGLDQDERALLTVPRGVHHYSRTV